jgi:hypothetical protein
MFPRYEMADDKNVRPASATLDQHLGRLRVPSSRQMCDAVLPGGEMSQHS